MKILFLLLIAGLACYAQNPTDGYFKLIRPGFQEKNAYETTAFVEKYFRVPGNTGFNASIHYVENILKKAGFVEQKQNEFEAPLTYRIEKRAIKNNTWEPVDANIDIVGETQPLISYKTNRNMIPINCGSTPVGGVTANVVYIEKIAPSEVEKMDLKGKILFSENNPSRLLQIATKAGAIGVLGYSMPKYTQPETHQTSIQFGSMKANSEVWTLLLSYAAKEKLKATCLIGETKLKVNIQTKIYPSEELTIVANVRGSVNPTERFVFSAHVQEPGANDNASGVGTLAEMARLTAELYQEKRSIRSAA
ncbi:M28 family peptidase [Pedobacter sp. P26]|uniref:M28 family peptidase n=1 Tax=Pedobacter sp. P26 TaxID=3423956 RepID=UPI003D66AD5E